MRTVLILLCLALVTVGAAYALLDPERRSLDDAARADAPGSFVRLTDGVTHYSVSGPDTGPVVVLAAGFSVPYYIWDPLPRALADSGFRVVRYDYFGRGWSDRPPGPYDQPMFVRQLGELLDSLGVREPVGLAGLSFGGAIITSFADAYPERVSSLIYVDPCFIRPSPLPFRRRSAAAWNAYMVLGGGTDELATGQLFDFLHPERHPDWVTRYRVQQQFRGTRAAIRASHLAIAAGPDQRDQLRRVAAHPRPVLVIWGREDRVIPFAESDSLLAIFNHAEFVPVDSAAHLPHLEQPDTVAGAVVRFLRTVPD
ncbi:MAG: alpha/beta hydrolase [Gemmatimonadota bacterium]|nr:alpha/beta hydrolase [Gemmatimonadota bacterium]